MEAVWANFMACHPRVTCHIAGCCNLTNSVSWSQNCVSHCRVLPPGEFNGMSSQRHVSHCRVLPLGEFTVMIPKPHATLQGVIIPSAILDIVFRRILFIVVFLNAVGLWRAAAFVSSPIHLFCIEKLFKTVFCICVWHTFITKNSEYCLTRRRTAGTF